MKTWFSKKMGIDPEKIVNVAVAPCTSKKYEITKEGGDAAGRYLGISGMRDMDISITTRELAQWAKSAGVDFDALGDAEFDSLSGTGAGAIFGSTGGVMEAVLSHGLLHFNRQKPAGGVFKSHPGKGARIRSGGHSRFGRGKSYSRSDSRHEKCRKVYRHHER